MVLDFVLCFWKWSQNAFKKRFLTYFAITSDAIFSVICPCRMVFSCPEQLYTWPCPSVRRSVGRSVGWSGYLVEIVTLADFCWPQTNLVDLRLTLLTLDDLPDHVCPSVCLSVRPSIRPLWYLCKILSLAEFCWPLLTLDWPCWPWIDLPDLELTLLTLEWLCLP